MFFSNTSYKYYSTNSCLDQCPCFCYDHNFYILTLFPLLHRFHFQNQSLTKLVHHYFTSYALNALPFVYYMIILSFLILLYSTLFSWLNVHLNWHLAHNTYIHTIFIHSKTHTKFCL
jgi:hypothetical protein